MNTELLTLFIKVAQLGSFAAVAREANIDPSAVSRAMASLEEQLNLRLFQRTTRQLKLTEAGEIYLQRIKPLLNELDYALDEAQKVSHTPSGHLRMTASVAFGQMCLLPYLSDFRQLYPNIQLELLLTDSVLDLVTNSLDLACRLNAQAESEAVRTLLFNTHYYVCVSPAYLAQHAPINTPQDLEQHNCIVFNFPDYRTHWTFKDHQHILTRISIQSNLSLSSALALRECALLGMGPALMADWLVNQDIAHGRLIPILTDYQVTAENFNTAAWLVYPSKHFLPHKTRLMIDFLKEKLS